MTKLILPEEVKAKEPAPQVSKFALKVVENGAQITLPFFAGDAGVTFQSRWHLARAIDEAIMDAIEAFCEEVKEGEMTSGE